MRISLAPATLRVSAVLAVSLALGLTVGCHRDPNKQKQRYLESGKRYADQGKLKEATIQFANALKVDHNFAEAHYQLSKVLLKQGSVMPAYGELMRTVDLQPEQYSGTHRPRQYSCRRQTDRPAPPNRPTPSSPSTRTTPMPTLCSPALPSPRETAPRRSRRSRKLSPSTRTAPASTPPSASAEQRSHHGSRRRRPAPQGRIARRQKRELRISSSPRSCRRRVTLKGAEDQMKAAIAADPKNVMARASLAELYLRQNDTAKAEATLRQAAEDLSDSESGAGLLATYYIRTNQLVPEQPPTPTSSPSIQRAPRSRSPICAF